MYAIDLSAVRSKLEKLSGFEGAAKKIRQYEAARSVEADLMSVDRTLENLKSIDAQPHLRRDFGAALMSHAVVTYCRATHSKADARFNVGATKRFSAAQMKKHRAIADLRDRVIAHFGFPGEWDGVNWHKERAYTRVIGDEELNGYAWARANYLASTAMDLSELTKLCLTTLLDIVTERDRAMTDALAEAMSDRQVQEIVASSPFDPWTFYDTPEAAEQFWRGPSVGEAYGPNLRQKAP